MVNHLILVLLLLELSSNKILAFTTTKAFSPRFSFIRTSSTKFPWISHRVHLEARTSSKGLYAANAILDLESQGVPFEVCDAKDVYHFSASLWSTMAKLSAEDNAQRVCLLIEHIPMNTLNSFEMDFMILKTQERLMNYLPELARFSITTIDNSPAFLIETDALTTEDIELKNRRIAVEQNFDESSVTKALKSFVDRIVIGQQACPYTKNVDFAATGLLNKGVLPGPVGYRYNGSSDACDALAEFWNCVCELIKTPETDISTTVLSLPAIGPGTSMKSHERFAAVMEIISRYLCLFRGDGMFGLVHFHPAYDRNLIHPVTKPAYGHLPPQSWLRAMLTMNGKKDEADALTDDQLWQANYQRRSPHTAINILRASHLNAAVGPKSIVDLHLENGVVEKASGIKVYSRNALTLANIPKVELDAALEKEISMQQQCPYQQELQERKEQEEELRRQQQQNLLEQKLMQQQDQKRKLQQQERIQQQQQKLLQEKEHERRLQLQEEEQKRIKQQQQHDQEWKLQQQKLQQQKLLQQQDQERKLHQHRQQEQQLQKQKLLQQQEQELKLQQQKQIRQQQQEQLLQQREQERKIQKQKLMQQQEQERKLQQQKLIHQQQQEQLLQQREQERKMQKQKLMQQQEQERKLQQLLQQQEQERKLQQQKLIHQQQQEQLLQQREQERKLQQQKLMQQQEQERKLQQQQQQQYQPSSEPSPSELLF